MRDSLDKVAAPIATRVDEVIVILRVHPRTPQINEYDARYSFEQRTAQGEVVESRAGTLFDKLTGPQQNQLKALLDLINSRAQGSVAP